MSDQSQWSTDTDVTRTDVTVMTCADATKVDVIVMVCVDVTKADVAARKWMARNVHGVCDDMPGACECVKKGGGTWRHIGTCFCETEPSGGVWESMWSWIELILVGFNSGLSD